MFNVFKAERLSPEYHKLVDCIILELNSAPSEVTELDEFILIDEYYIVKTRWH